MIRAAIYEIATGRIVQIVGSDEAESIDMIVEAGQAVAVAPEGIDDSTNYVKAGQFKPYPNRPSPSHQWNPATETWGDTRSLEQVKTDRLASLAAARDADFYANATIGGRTHPFDERSRARIMEFAVQALANPGALSVDIGLADGSVATITKAELLAVAKAIFDRNAAVATKAKAVKEALAAATTKAQVSAVTW